MKNKVTHKEIIPLIKQEIGGDPKTVSGDITPQEKEESYKIIKNFVNENTNGITKPINFLKENGYCTIGKVVESKLVLSELSKFPVYNGHVKTYSNQVPIMDYHNRLLPNGIYSWSMEDLLKCKSITDLATNPLIIQFISDYLECLPTCYSLNCMLSDGTSGHGTTVPHRDLDDFKWITLFVYLSGGKEESGAHVFEPKSHLGNPNGEKGYEVRPQVSRPVILTAPSGHGFVTDSWGVHYGKPLTYGKRRICLWIRYGLYDNWTSRVSDKIHELDCKEHSIDMSSEINKYVFRFLVD